MYVTQQYEESLELNWVPFCLLESLRHGLSVNHCQSSNTFTYKVSGCHWWSNNPACNLSEIGMAGQGQLTSQNTTVPSYLSWTGKAVLSSSRNTSPMDVGRLAGTNATSRQHNNGLQLLSMRPISGTRSCTWNIKYLKNAMGSSWQFWIVRCP